MDILGVTVNIGLCVLCFIIGRCWQKWSDGTMDVEESAYQAGYEEGHIEGRKEGWYEGQQNARHQGLRGSW